MEAILFHWATWLVLAAVMFIAVVLLSSLQVIGANQSGLVVRRFGKPLPAGRLIAMDGEAGYQADLLPPGWHFGYWPWSYKVVRTPLVVIPPERLGSSWPPTVRRLRRRTFSGTRSSATTSRTRARSSNGGERGRQLGFLRAGTYRINPSLFQVVTADNAGQFGMHPSNLQVFSVPSDKVGIVSTNDGRPIATGDLAASVVEGHDNFQRAQAFIDGGGGRGCRSRCCSRVRGTPGSCASSWCR